jgi:polysaccharide deacetylase 2 family uncharacterized protein YibQ
MRLPCTCGASQRYVALVNYRGSAFKGEKSLMEKIKKHLLSQDKSRRYTMRYGMN